MSPPAYTPGTVVRPSGSTSTPPPGRSAQPSWAAKGARWLAVAAVNTPATRSTRPSAYVSSSPPPTSVTSARSAGRTMSADATTGRSIRSIMSPWSPSMRIATRSPANSWPWQKGHCATRLPHCCARPGTAGNSSRMPVASTRRRACSVPSAVDTAKSPSAPEAAATVVVRTSTVG